MKSVVTTLTDVSGVVVAEVLRNRQGMYIHRQGMPKYGRCVQKLVDLKQEHQFTNIEITRPEDVHPPKEIKDSVT